jgi:hypothetical protein
LARHPRRGNEAPDRSLTEFYYILRQADERNIAKRVSRDGSFHRT